MMNGTVLYGPKDVRFEKRDEPEIVKSTDAIIRITAACVCGSDLWPYHGLQETAEPLPMDQVVEGYRAMDKRRAIKALLRP
jgi:threonine dehydrogenase-like Zn-dependent dehydrogenase